MDPRALLIESFAAAVAAADPARVLAAHLPDQRAIAGYRRTLVVGAGKAAASMAAALEAHWPSDASLEGLVVTRYGHGMDCRRIDVIEAGHPVPDSAGEEAARTILASCAQLAEGDLLVVLVSGGASLEMIGKLLGHSQLQTTQRYAHLMDSPLRAGVDAVASAFRPRPKLVHDAEGDRKTA